VDFIDTQIIMRFIVTLDAAGVLHNYVCVCEYSKVIGDSSSSDTVRLFSDYFSGNLLRVSLQNRLK